MPVTQEIDATRECFIGEDKRLVFTWRDSGGLPVAVPGGWTLRFSVALTRYHPNVLITKTLASGITVDPDQVGAGKGKIYVQMDAADYVTAGMVGGRYYYALRRTDAGNVDVGAEGPFVLLRAAGV